MDKRILSSQRDIIFRRLLDVALRALNDKAFLLAWLDLTWAWYKSNLVITKFNTTKFSILRKDFSVPRPNLTSFYLSILRNLKENWKVPIQKNAMRKIFFYSCNAVYRYFFTIFLNFCEFLKENKSRLDLTKFQYNSRFFRPHPVSLYRALACRSNVCWCSGCHLC
jgi:hypothetical protein